jgi:hypothetical protein
MPLWLMVTNAKDNKLNTRRPNKSKRSNVPGMTFKSCDSSMPTPIAGPRNTQKSLALDFEDPQIIKIKLMIAYAQRPSDKL